MKNLQSIIAGTHRSSENVERDKYRNPLETLEFFKIEPHHIVAEIWPGSGGYYTEILAPYLRQNGRYIAAAYDDEFEDSFDPREASARFHRLLSSAPGLYDKTDIVPFSRKRNSLGKNDSVDVVVTFRNLHNFTINQWFDVFLNAVHAVLKRDAHFCIVEHRSNDDETIVRAKETGYLPETQTIQIIEAAGFQLVSKSEINANPNDTKNHPKGVWSLPPWGDRDHPDYPKYAAIGESDRMTLRFCKK